MILSSSHFRLMKIKQADCIAHPVVHKTIQTSWDNNTGQPIILSENNDFHPRLQLFPWGTQWVSNMLECVAACITYNVFPEDVQSQKWTHLQLMLLDSSIVKSLPSANYFWLRSVTRFPKRVQTRRWSFPRLSWTFGSGFANAFANTRKSVNFCSESLEPSQNWIFASLRRLASMCKSTWKCSRKSPLNAFARAFPVN